MNEQQYRDSFSIGTSATGGAIKVYLDGDKETRIKQIGEAIEIWNMASTEFKKLKEL